MNTPIRDFVRGYAASQPLRLHMPGHKGQAVLGVEAEDITELPGADVLYAAQGIIHDSQENASRLFGSGKTLYSTEGSSLSIRAMVYLTALYAAQRGEKPRILAGRNAHKVLIHAAALLDVSVTWLYPEQDDPMVCTPTPRMLEEALSGELPTAVYLTSPDYLGNMADLPALAQVCHGHGVVLLVDNAHGAYLKFLPESRHPLDLGADVCCDSAHKTLPVLTGGGYLHISREAPAMFARLAERAMAMFASTSPSYLILQSLDMANAYLEGLVLNPAPWERIKQRLRSAGFVLTGQEPLKLTLLPKSYGYTGEALARELEKRRVFCEFADRDHLVLMCPAEPPAGLEELLLSLPPRPALEEQPPRLPQPQQAVSPHRAIFMQTQELAVRDSAGRVMASAAVSCPPAIPIVACGERIDETAIRAMEYYGIHQIQVLREPFV